MSTETNLVPAMRQVPAPPRDELLEPFPLDALLERGKFLCRTGFFQHLKSPEQAAAAVLLGHQLDLDMMTAAMGIYVVNGRPSLNTQTMVALVRRSAECEWIRPVRTSPDSATWATLRRGDPDPTDVTVTLEMARKAGWPQRNQHTWADSETMLGWRAASRLCRRVYPDLLAGLVSAEEMGDEPPRRIQARVESEETGDRASDLKAKLQASLGATEPHVVDVEPAEPRPDVEPDLEPSSPPDPPPPSPPEREPDPEIEEKKAELIALKEDFKHRCDDLGIQKSRQQDIFLNAVKSTRGARSVEHYEERIQQARALLERANLGVRAKELRGKLIERLGDSGQNWIRTNVPMVVESPWSVDLDGFKESLNVLAEAARKVSEE